MAAPDRAAFVQSLAPLAQKWEARTGIPASIWLAMAASESNWGAAGTSLFGIKGSGTAGSLNSPTWESVNGQRVDTTDNFAAYRNADEAFQGFWNFLHDNPRYAEALKSLPNDPRGFLQGINQAGYATDPQWSRSIESIAANQITPMLGASGQGERYMAAQKDGLLATSADDGTSIAPGDIISAVIGDTSSAPSGASDPSAGLPTPYGPPAPSTAFAPSDAGLSPLDGTTILRLIEAKIGSGETRAIISKPTVRVTDRTGLVKDVPNQEQIAHYTWPDGKSLDVVYQTGKPAYIKGGSALTVLSTGTAPDVRTFPDGSLRQYDPDAKQWTKIADPPDPNAKAPKTLKTPEGTYQYDPSAGWQLIPGTSPKSARVQIHQMPDGSLAQYDPDTGQWATIQGPNGVDQGYKVALTAEAQANAAKIQLGLRPVAQAAIEDAGRTIDAIQAQWAAGKIQPAEANQLMAEVHQGLQATLAGTTLFEQKKQAQDTETQRAQTASSFLNQRVQSAASLGQSLFNAATGHVLMPKGQSTLGIDPLAIANGEVNQMGGGQQTGDLAAQFLRGAFGQGTAPGAAPPGQPGPSANQFPTTREQVLAAYPELAQAAATPPGGTPNTNAPLQPAAPPAFMPQTGRE